jgi:hypothetical protein
MYFAKTAEGREVPILDYRQDIFRHAPPSRLQNIRSLVGLRGLIWLPGPWRRRLAHQSELLSGFLLRDSQSPLSGQATYLAKLGPKVPQTSLWDKIAAGSVQSIESARRGFCVASLESRLLAELIHTSPSHPITFLNIGGGPASDNLNALLLLREHSADLYRKLVEQQIPISIQVLDPDPSGVVLGQRSLAVLQAEGGPLAGAAVKLEHHFYDWSQPQTLRPLLNQARGAALVCAEGSLFEYGSDEEIAANWQVIADHTPPAAALIGTVFHTARDINLVAKRMLRLSPRMGWKFRGFDPIARLAQGTPWIAEAQKRDNSIYLTFALRRKA